MPPACPYLPCISPDPEADNKLSYRSEAGQVNGSVSGRHDVGPDFLQRYEVSLGGLDGEERRDDNWEKCQECRRISTARVHHSLKSPACSCVSITLPASS